MPSHKVIGTIKSIKGKCSWGHQVGDTFEISDQTGSGLCGRIYYTIYPNVVMLQNGGGDEARATTGIIMRCPDINNEVTIEIRRIK